MSVNFNGYVHFGGMIRKLAILLLLLLLSPSWGQDCDENMILYDCVGEEFCNDQPLYGFDCYVANDLCEDFNGDGIITDWIGDGYCDDGTWGIDFQCDEYGWDCGDCGGEIVDPNGYCGSMGTWQTFNDNGQIIFLENKSLYSIPNQYHVEKIEYFNAAITDDNYPTITLSLNEFTSADVTIVCYGGMTPMVMKEAIKILSTRKPKKFKRK